MEPDSERECSSAHMLELIGEHLGVALRAGAVGRWAWDTRSDQLVWSIPDSVQLPGRDELTYGTLADFVLLAIPADRRGLETALRDGRYGQEINHTFRYDRSDRSVGRMDVIGVAVAGTDVFVGISRDSTERMLADEQLAASFAVRDRVARALEASLLPHALPTVPGFTFDADYRSCEGPATGDFYDLFPLAGADWGLTIGDVGGHGTDAAAITTAIRYSLRAAALVRRSPARVMAACNDVHLEAVHGDRFTTAHYVRIHRRSGGVEIRVATAGHPEILIRRHDGPIEAIRGQGPMLGLMRKPDFREDRADIEVGDLVAFYTDGVTEARHGDTFFGRKNLEAFLLSWKGPVDGCAAALHDAATSFSGGIPRDDMATVVARRES